MYSRLCLEPVYYQRVEDLLYLGKLVPIYISERLLYFINYLYLATVPSLLYLGLLNDSL